MNNNERYNQIIRTVFELEDYVEINKSMTRKNTPKWDSLLHLTLIVAIEDEFSTMLDTDDILNFNSYTDGLNIINSIVSEN